VKCPGTRKRSVKSSETSKAP